jgi:hypothetical protein
MFFQYFFKKTICNHKLKSIYIHLLNLWDFLILTFCFWLNLNCCDTSNYHKVTCLLPPPSMAGLYLFAGPFVRIPVFLTRFCPSSPKISTFLFVMYHGDICFGLIYICPSSPNVCACILLHY